ncbi:MAG: non-canonical purine NTP pyrophosphatase [Actinobacteria bacterium]|nr:non-canonical purine NTP pyrophosphatase [Actinomycetota bacterium]
MTFPERLAIASRNPHKLREIVRICADWPVEWVTSEGHGGEWPEVDEPFETYRENALHKARSVAAALGVAALADDSGIEVDALWGGPGPRSARFAGDHASDAENLAKLIREIARVSEEQWTARYRCVAVIAFGDARSLEAEGKCEGTLITEPRGDRGFGYDPVFVPKGSARAMAELADDEKDEISHRGLALRELGRLLAEADGGGAT